MNGRNDEREIEDDGFETLYFSLPGEYQSPVPDCLRCMDTGYVRNWRGAKDQCPDCWQDNGPE
jgi:hypothetical protein